MALKREKRVFFVTTFVTTEFRKDKHFILMTKYLSSNLLVMIHSQCLETGWQTPGNLWPLGKNVCSPTGWQVVAGG